MNRTADSSLVIKVRGNALFQSVDELLLQSVAGKLEEKQVPSGTIIFEDGAEGGCLYLLLSGSVRIAKVLPTGEEVVLGILEAGEFFGELDLIDERRRSARAVAETQCLVARLDRNEFSVLLKASPAFTRNLLRMVSHRLRMANLTYVQHEETNLTAAHRQLEKTHKLIEASKTVNSSLDLTQVLELILGAAVRTTGADRGTVYVIDRDKGELWSKVLEGTAVVDIRLPLGKGIAGTVAVTGETVNIADAYRDPRFNPDVDRLTGYHTTTLLTMPLKNRHGAIVGVFQLLNKAGGSFTPEDEAFIEGFSAHAALALENAQMVIRMMQNERLSAVGRMASSIIHDIKNPLGVMRISAQLIKSKTEDSDSRQLAGHIVDQIDRFITMTQEILDYARGVSTLNVQTVNFGELMGMSLSTIEEDLRRRGMVLVRNLGFTGQVHVDPDKLIRAFYNIAGNAADAMHDGGRLTVSTFTAGTRVVVEFTDTGHGIPPSLHNRLFEPFFSHGKKHGTGLGMAIVKKIVDDHHGTIEVTSDVGRGTSVRIMIPRE